MRVLAAAKINWGLHVCGRRSDGYHILDTLMQNVSLYDTLTFAPSQAISLTTTAEGIDEAALGETYDNLVIRAAKMIAKDAGRPLGVHIYLHKAIPVGAGLGGGSSDAAAALVALQKYWNLALPADVLADMALELGADVPFFLRGGLQRARGIGEVLSPRESPPAWPMLLCIPHVRLSTRDVFARTANLPPNDIAIMNHLEKSLTNADMQGLSLLPQNHLQIIASQLCPEIDTVFHALGIGSVACAMSGSGPCCFAVYPDEIARQKAQTRMQSMGYWCKPVTPIASAYHVEEE